MKMTEVPVEVEWKMQHYVFIESVGPFEQTAQKAWEKLHPLLPELAVSRKLLAFTSLFRVEPEMIYRAGVFVDKPPQSLPKELKYEMLEGGKYTKYILTGAYANLPDAWGKVFGSLSGSGISVRDDFFIENYANDPKVTPEEKLVTELMIPSI